MSMHDFAPASHKAVRVRDVVCQITVFLVRNLFESVVASEMKHRINELDWRIQEDLLGQANASRRIASINENSCHFLFISHMLVPWYTVFVHMA
jgi:hypothetical protein